MSFGWQRGQRGSLIAMDLSGATMSASQTLIVCRWIKIIWLGVMLSVVNASGVPQVHPSNEAIERLSRVFGIDRVPVHVHKRSPPEFMLSLFNAVAYSDGISKQPTPYDADVVRGFPDKESMHQTHFRFNLSLVKVTEGVLEAEFHIYRLRGRPPDTDRPGPTRAVHLVDLRLFQVLDAGSIHSLEQLRPLDFRRVSAHTSGWEIFRVSDTVRDWLNDSSTNHGFLVTATSLDGSHVNGSHVRFAQRYEHHQSKQPVLVTYTTEQEPEYFLTDLGGVETSSPANDRYGEDPEMQTMRRTYVQFLNEGFRADHGFSPRKPRRNYMSPTMHQQLLLDAARSRASPRSRSRRDETSSKRLSPSPAEGREGMALHRTKRSKRSSDYFRRRRRKLCGRSELYVDFDDIGWSGWIISPKGYNAYHCKGDCAFPLGQNQQPTNHATVQSIVHAMRIGKDVDMPCCVPDKLYSISLLYFDDDENVILKQYDDMVAATCGCH